MLLKNGTKSFDRALENLELLAAIRALQGGNNLDVYDFYLLSEYSGSK